MSMSLAGHYRIYREMCSHEHPKSLPYLHGFADQVIGYSDFIRLLPQINYFEDNERAIQLKERLIREENLAIVNHVDYLSILHNVRKLYKKERCFFETMPLKPQPQKRAAPMLSPLRLLSSRKAFALAKNLNKN